MVTRATLLCKLRLMRLNSVKSRMKKADLVRELDKVTFVEKSWKECINGRCIDRLIELHKSNRGFEYMPDSNHDGDEVFTVYGESYCPWCTKAVLLLFEKKKHFIYYPHPHDPDKLPKEGATYPYVPLIYRGDVMLEGGYDELRRII